MKKEYVGAGEFLRDSFTLAGKVFESGYRPDTILALWRGGAPVAMAVHEFLLRKGLDVSTQVMKVESYKGSEQQSSVRMEHVDQVLAALPEGCRLLVVDDIFDTGNSIAEVVSVFSRRTDMIKIATVFYRSDRGRIDLAPDFFVRRTDRWVVFPHELSELTDDEIRTKDDFLGDLLG